MEALYIEAMDELLAKDMRFFQDNYAGSLTKRALGYARRFEDVFDVLSFQVAPTLLSLVFAGVVLWTYSGWLILVLVGMLVATVAMVFPLIRRRRAAGGRARICVQRARGSRGRLDHERRSRPRVRAGT